MNQVTGLIRDDAYKRIRELVLSGRFGSDVALSERSLASIIGLGRTPVREALKALARDGLLVIHPMRGTFVRQLSFEDLREIHEMRMALEGMAAWLAAGHGASPELDAAAHALQQMSDMDKVGVEAAQQLGWAYHEALMRASGNTRLVAAYEGLRGQSGLALQKIRRYSLERTRHALAEHLAIHAAVLARDAQKARELMLTHLTQAFDARLAALGSPRPRPE